MATTKDNRTGFISIYEVLVWLVYVCLFKYGIYAGSEDLPRMRMNFPFPQLILFSIAMTLYTIPFYRLIAPWLLKRKSYVLLFFVTLIYFVFVSRWINWGVTFIFNELNTNSAMNVFYQKQFSHHNRAFFAPAGNFSVLLTDWLAFFSVMFMRYAFDNERKRHALEKDNLVLQLETLKAQLHPHFLFNMLNNIYGMSITGSKQTPEYILRLSDMMRYVLYDCSQNQVPLKKDIEFLENYLEMEKKRYPHAVIAFSIEGNMENKTIAPLLLIPFVENSFKHGAHRLTDSGKVNGSVKITESTLLFSISNDILIAAKDGPANKQYGGVGISNVKKRLELFYPERHELDIASNEKVFSVIVKIQL